MAGRSEVGSLGFVRHQGGDAVRGQIKGVGGHARAANAGGLTAHRHATPAEAPAHSYARPPALAGYASRSAAAPPPFSAPPPSGATAMPPSAPAVEDRGRQEARGQLEDLQGDVESVKGRVDGLYLRVSNQDTALKALERSASALRQEYSSVSQATDAQSGPRMDALERSLGRLDAAFQDFSSRLERRLSEVEGSATAAAAAEVAGAVPYDATALVALAPDLPPLSRVFLFAPMTKEADGAISMQRRSLDAQGRPTQTSVRIQTPAGEPLVVFS